MTTQTINNLATSIKSKRRLGALLLALTGLALLLTGCHDLEALTGWECC